MAKHCAVLYGGLLGLNWIITNLPKSVEGKCEPRGTCIACDVAYTSNEILALCARCGGALTGKGAPVG